MPDAPFAAACRGAAVARASPCQPLLIQGVYWRLLAATLCCRAIAHAGAAIACAASHYALRAATAFLRAVLSCTVYA